MSQQLVRWSSDSYFLEFSKIVVELGEGVTNITKHSADFWEVLVVMTDTIVACLNWVRY